MTITPENTILSNERGLIVDSPLRQYAHLQYADSEKILDVQFRLLNEQLDYAFSKSPYYRRLFNGAEKNWKALTPFKGAEESGKVLAPFKDAEESRNSLTLFKSLDGKFQGLSSMEDLAQIPFTEKAHLENAGDFLTVSPEEIVDICLTSATTGPHPTMVPQTAGDIARLAYNEEMAFRIAGITASDTVMICAAMDRCFMAGLAYFMGSLKLQTTAVRAGSSNAAHLWELVKLTKPTVIIGVPSLMHLIGTYAIENKEHPDSSGIKKLVAIGEPIRDGNLDLLTMATALESMWDAPIFSTYASTELATTFCECESRCGGHLRPEMNVIEIVDENGKNLPDGEPGEVITTPLGITGMPLIRFRTNDISFIIDKPCSCGRTTKRLAPVLGRKNQMLKYKGTTVFPNAIISALEGDARFHTGFVEALKNQDGTDRVTLFVSLTEPASGTSWLEEKIRAKVRVVPEIQVISCEKADNIVYQFNKKRKRTIFFDKRG
ncbi:AMP-dependent synthetase and ligase [Desulfamplus magnetovallimortis]|uniref:AMP-dependent synthetase and ligase n=1 Tax=Desulfamplus magnetovallimortis TaxID=1246637 RepID=L0R5F9_9BACT|nr:AMP-binding protein [Desulfamplus magnetovallimortis]CCO06752.1 AMP-dependent synthetase and ligase [Desulfamplus magnetovallimortis BW-1]SLM32803.1 AMP-dependent synthetase and ligase [Desulfamplus magnetovallimortis]